MISPNYFRICDVAILLQLSPTTVRRMCLDGRLTSYRIGRQIRVASEDLDSFLKSRLVPPLVGSSGKI
jgi:excisionase family DNA binding protein